MTNREIAKLAFAIASAAGKDVAQLTAALDASDAAPAAKAGDVVGTARTEFPMRDAETGAVIGRRVIIETVMANGTRGAVADDVL